MYVKTSLRVPAELAEWKKKNGYKWPWLLQKARYYLEEIQPKQEMIAQNYQNATRTAGYTRILHYIRQKYPDIYGEITEVAHGQNLENNRPAPEINRV